MTTVEVLKKARTKVSRRYGWTQNIYQDRVYLSPGSKKKLAHPVQCFCAAGAIKTVAKDRREEDAAFKVLARVLGTVRDDNGKVVTLSEPHAKILHWNDKDERTQADVVAAFDAAIEKAGSL